MGLYYQQDCNNLPFPFTPLSALAPNASNEQANLLALALSAGLSVARGEATVAELEFFRAWLDAAFQKSTQGAMVQGSATDLAAAAKRLGAWMAKYPVQAPMVRAVIGSIITIVIITVIDIW